MSITSYFQSHSLSFILVMATLGLLVGSFLNVVIHRLPKMLERDWRRQCADLLEQEAPPDSPPLNLVVPRSRCPQCGHGITALENIPVISFLILRGRCGDCGWRIPVRYPLVEIASAVLAAVVAWRFGVSWAVLGALVLTWALLAVAVIDLDTMLLPDDITLPLLWLGLLLNSGSLYVPLSDAVWGAALGYASLWLVFHLFRLATGKEGMGFGDFKLLAMLGAWLGWQSLPLVILLSSAAGAIIGIGLIMSTRRKRETPMPFGPYLAIAGWIALIWGDELTSLYLGTIGP